MQHYGVPPPSGIVIGSKEGSARQRARPIPARGCPLKKLFVHPKKYTAKTREKSGKNRKKIQTKKKSTKKRKNPEKFTKKVQIKYQKILKKSGKNLKKIPENQEWPISRISVNFAILFEGDFLSTIIFPFSLR